MERWAELLGVEWVWDHKTEYAVTIFTISSRKYNEEEIKPRLILVIIKKLWRDTSSGKSINCKAIPRDFERINKGDVVLPVTSEHLEEFNLYINKDRVFRPNDSHGRVQILPPLLPPPLLDSKESYREETGLLSNQAYSSFTLINQPESFSVSSSALTFSCVLVFSAAPTPVACASSVPAGPAPAFNMLFSEFLSSAALLLMSADLN